MKSILDTGKWKIYHGEQGSSISYPYYYKGNKSEVEDAWIIGPLDKNVAEWLFDAIERKQLTDRVLEAKGVFLVAPTGTAIAKVGNHYV